LIDPDAKIWNEDGTEMTPVKITIDHRNNRKAVKLWLKQCEGEHVITPTYVFFEIGAEATLFGLMF